MYDVAVLRRSARSRWAHAAEYWDHSASNAGFQSWELEGQVGFNEDLADRLRTTLASFSNVTEMRMFGGVAFFSQGNMACGVYENSIFVRVSSEEYEKVLSKPHARVFDLTGKPMKGWVLVEPAGIETDDALSQWVKIGVAFASSLPPK